MERPHKRARLLSDESGSEDEGFESANSGNTPASVPQESLKINDDYAKRFEHNQQRAERQRLEEKYGKTSDATSDSESDSESEDDDGELVTKELDDQINATLNAIRSKDPRVYNPDSVFYAAGDDPSAPRPSESKQKPVHLRDYHRQNLLDDAEGGADSREERLPTYAEEQSALKQNLLDQMHDPQQSEGSDRDSDNDGDDFLVKKPGQDKQAQPASSVPLQELDVATADRDPETYLSNFMAARAWIPTVSSKSHPFESDDDEDDERADAFEQAYNMRFEDPEHANEKLISHSREAAAKHSVRRDELKGRRKAREAEKAQRDAEKELRREEKARLRRLKIDEAQEKWLRLKDAAGLRQQHLSDQVLMRFLEKGFEEDDWDAQMTKILGEDYDNDNEDDQDFHGDEADGDHRLNKKHPKKPTWDDDINIDDIVPDFNEQEERQANAIALSDEDEPLEGDNGPSKDTGDTMEIRNQNKSSKQDRAAKKREARLERQKIEAMVDSHLATSFGAELKPQSSTTAPFRYRETSPTTHGLSARDILMATDSQLNQFAGLKKLATFRDGQKKSQDRKKLGKKARLRQWRKETFGHEDGSTISFEEFFNRGRGLENGPQGPVIADRIANGDEPVPDNKKKKRKRSKKGRGPGNEAASPIT